MFFIYFSYGNQIGNYDCCKKNAQVAELVDALVSNTSGSNTVPVRPRPWVL